MYVLFEGELLYYFRRLFGSPFSSYYYYLAEPQSSLPTTRVIFFVSFHAKNRDIFIPVPFSCQTHKTAPVHAAYFPPGSFSRQHV